MCLVLSPSSLKHHKAFSCILFHLGVLRKTAWTSELCFYFNSNKMKGTKRNNMLKLLSSQGWNLQVSMKPLTTVL